MWHAKLILKELCHHVRICSAHIGISSETIGKKSAKTKSKADCCYLKVSMVSKFAYALHKPLFHAKLLLIVFNFLKESWCKCKSSCSVRRKSNGSRKCPSKEKNIECLAINCDCCRHSKV